MSLYQFIASKPLQAVFCCWAPAAYLETWAQNFSWPMTAITKSWHLNSPSLEVYPAVMETNQENKFVIRTWKSGNATTILENSILHCCTYFTQCKRKCSSSLHYTHYKYVGQLGKQDTYATHVQFIDCEGWCAVLPVRVYICDFSPNISMAPTRNL